MAHLIGLIPARSGSKGLPGKNIKTLNGKPLLAYTVEAATNCNCLGDVFVSSDDPEILSVGRQYGAIEDRRPASLAEDATSMKAVIADFIHRHDLPGDSIIVLLQPTSPLRSDQHISEAVKWYRENNCAALVSVYKVDSRLLYAYVEDEQYLAPASPQYSGVTARQGLPNLYMPNGAIYIFSVAAFTEENDIPTQRVVPFVMSEDDSIDIDTEADLRRCSRIMLSREEASHSL